MHKMKLCTGKRFKIDPSFKKDASFLAIWRGFANEVFELTFERKEFRPWRLKNAKLNCRS